jgi:type I restriction enzyme R subunit
MTRKIVRLGALAERYFRDDPATSLIKMRQFGETLAQLAAAKAGMFRDIQEGQADVIRRLKFERVIPEQVGELFHHLRVAGNRATHENEGNHGQALTALKIGTQLGIWFHRTFGHTGNAKSFSPGPFVPPPDPAAATNELMAELGKLRSDLDEQRTQAERLRIASEEHAQARLSAEAIARQERDDRVVWEQLAAQLATMQATAVEGSAKTSLDLITKAQAAASSLNLDEASTRALIDDQLRARGWEADTQNIRYSRGTRPAKGHNFAIAEWPTKTGPADYALFIGTRCIGVVEAKRRNKNVSSNVDQAQRYSLGFRFEGGAEPIGGPWPDPAAPNSSDADPFLVPYVFSANGRPYLKQVETGSGIWFRDVRKPSNHSRVLVDWPTPAGLEAILDIDADAADAELKTKPFHFGFPLRPYQQLAIEKVEEALAGGRRSMLLAMATGTGKTKLAIAMLYRLLAAKRFRRICFVVDRHALGAQAAGEFATTRIVSTRTFSDIFGLKGLDTVTPDSETRVHICTIQGLVKRVLFTEDISDSPPVDQYDLIVVDECHRGYLLDREMSDAELSFRSQDDYISKYRRVLEHFDAVKIGLTATPALHTANIFGKPIFQYSYREAVIDGYLIDHEPPVQITTALSQSGIRFKKGQQIGMLDSQTGKVDLAEVPDEIHFEVDEFNKKVITVPFNRAVAGELATHIDPSLPGKTLVFAATDAQADIVVAELKAAFAAVYGEVEDGAIRKITGSVDRPGALILSFRNDEFPKIAVTVDLLTTGVDVPAIVNLVFLRRVNSRILYEQMLGRATRRCEQIGKETFRIFDAVDLYPHLQNLTEMRPVVVDPQISLKQLFEEFARVGEDLHREMVRDQIMVKMRRRLRHLQEQARAMYEKEAGESPESTLDRLAESPASISAAWVKARPSLGTILDWDPEAGGLRLTRSRINRTE